MSQTLNKTTVKEYFTRAYHLDTSIDNKLDQISHLRAQATKATVALSDMPRSDSPNPQSLENLLVKMVDLEHEITAEIDALVDIKRELRATIKEIPNPAHRVLLELRYLCFKTWEQIASDMGIEERYAYMLHGKALTEAGKIIFA